MGDGPNRGASVHYTDEMVGVLRSETEGGPCREQRSQPHSIPQHSFPSRFSHSLTHLAIISSPSILFFFAAIYKLFVFPSLSKFSQPSQYISAQKTLNLDFRGDKYLSTFYADKHLKNRHLLEVSAFDARKVLLQAHAGVSRKYGARGLARTK